MKFEGVASFSAAKVTIRESFLRKNFIFHQFTVFSLESFPLYNIPSDINSSWIRYVKAIQDDCWMLSVVC